MSTLITPFEAVLMWTVHKKGKDDSRIPFIGKDSLANRVDDNKDKIKRDRKRVGFTVN